MVEGLVGFTARGGSSPLERIERHDTDHLPYVDLP
jgi:hypothetical protein